jgi:phage-related protein
MHRMMLPRPQDAKPLFWLTESKHTLSAFPPDVRDEIGQALWVAQLGAKSPRAKPLKGFGDGSVLEVVDNFDGNAYRAVYTIRFAQAIYVLHVFQKKSHRGVSMPRRDIELIRLRLAQACEDYHQWQENLRSPRDQPTKTAPRGCS